MTAPYPLAWPAGVMTIDRARLIAADLHPNSAWASRVLAGKRDDDDAVRAAIAALKVAEVALLPASHDALEHSIADIDAFERDGISLCEIENEVSFTESVLLCVHELKRLRALTSEVVR